MKSLSIWWSDVPTGLSPMSAPGAFQELAELLTNYFGEELIEGSVGVDCACFIYTKKMFRRC